MSAFPASISAWFQSVLASFGEITWYTWVALFVLLALALLIFAVSGKRKWTPLMLAHAAISLSLSFVLSYVKLYSMPNSGSITAGSMLPLMLFAAAYGVRPGLLAGAAYGLLQFMQNPQFINVWQFLLDYLLAFSALGLAGIVHESKKDSMLLPGIVLAVCGRTLSATFAGLMWAALYGISDITLPWIGTFRPASAFVYSLLYNGIYLFVELVICLLLALFAGKRILKIMRAKPR